MWALARWADTYLFPEEDLPAPLKQAYGDPAASSNGGDGAAAAGAPQPHQPGSGEGLAVLDMAVQVANACLTSFPGEGELHKQVCACASGGVAPLMLMLHAFSWDAPVSSASSWRPDAAVQRSALRSLHGVHRCASGGRSLPSALVGS